MNQINDGIKKHMMYISAKFSVVSEERTASVFRVEA
jgi:hypothetical protein